MFSHYPVPKVYSTLKKEQGAAPAEPVNLSPYIRFSNPTGISNDLDQLQDGTGQLLPIYVSNSTVNIDSANLEVSNGIIITPSITVTAIPSGVSNDIVTSINPTTGVLNKTPWTTRQLVRLSSTLGVGATLTALRDGGTGLIPISVSLSQVYIQPGNNVRLNIDNIDDDSLNIDIRGITNISSKETAPIAFNQYFGALSLGLDATIGNVNHNLGGTVSSGISIGCAQSGYIFLGEVAPSTALTTFTVADTVVYLRPSTKLFNLPGITILCPTATGGLKIGAEAVNTAIGFFGHATVVQQNGGAANAGVLYTANEQGMINRMYSALRNYGLLS